MVLREVPEIKLTGLKLKIGNPSEYHKGVQKEYETFNLEIPIKDSKEYFKIKQGEIQEKSQASVNLQAKKAIMAPF